MKTDQVRYRNTAGHNASSLRMTLKGELREHFNEADDDWRMFPMVITFLLTLPSTHFLH